MMRWVLLLLLSIGTAAAQPQGGPYGSAGITGGTITNATIGSVTYGLTQDVFAIAGGGTGYVAGDSITLTCAGCAITTNPTVVVAAVSGGVITIAQPRQTGVFTKAPTGNITFTQSATSGIGSGATFTGTLAPIASILNMPSLSSGGGSNGNLFLMGSEGPCSQMLAAESTHFGDKAGLGLAVGQNDSNVLMGHNVAGNGSVTCGAHLDSSWLGGSDAARNIQGNNTGIVGGGPSGWRNINGAANNTGFGVQVGINCSSCSNNGLWGTSAPTLTTGIYNQLFGTASDVATGSTSHTIQFAGQFGNVLSATSTNSTSAVTWTIPGYLLLTGDHGASTYDLQVTNGISLSGTLASNGSTSFGCCASFQAGLGSVNHLTGPTDQTFNILSGVAAQTTTAVTAKNLAFSTPSAVAGSSVAGAAAGGDMTFTTGAAARLTSGGATGGSYTITLGKGLSGNSGGSFGVTTGGVASPNGLGPSGSIVMATAAPDTVGTGNGGPASGLVSVLTGTGGAVSSNGNTSGNSGTFTLGTGTGGANSGTGGTAGSSGAFTLSTGAGGAANGASGTRTGGNSGTLTIQTGAAGVGSSVNGSVGSIVISPGGVATVTASTTAVTMALPVILKNYTVATLPTCSGVTYGFAAVSDATAPTYNGALTGGGSVKVPVFCDGSAWTSH